MLCVSCGSLVAVVRHWLGLHTRVMGICSHVAGSGSLVCARAKAEGYCRQTHQAGHRVGCGVPLLTHPVLPGGGQAEYQPEVSDV